MRVASCPPRRSPEAPPPSAASYVSAASTLNSLMAIPEGTPSRVSAAAGTKRIVCIPTVWACGFQLPLPLQMAMFLTATVAEMLKQQTYSAPSSQDAKGRSM